MSVAMTRLIPAFTWAALLAVIMSHVASAPAEPATKPADLEMELQILEDFRSIQSKQANKPVDDLIARYKAALEKYRNDSQTAGKLDAVLSAKEALDKLAAGETPGGSSDAGVAYLDKSYQAKLPAAQAAVSGNLLKVEREYLASLDKLVAKLTKAGQLDDAVKVKGIREALVAGMKERMKTNGPVSEPQTGKAAPPDMVLIPAGSFQMGDTFKEGGPDELPVHTVSVSAFYMGKYEVTKALWDEVRAWGMSNGYWDLANGDGKGPNHPVHTISWFATVKWCNARSEKEGLVPCYTVRGVVYKTQGDAPTCNWAATGYRLPTEAEWEKAARGGLKGRRFPWGDSISHKEANYVLRLA